MSNGVLVVHVDEGRIDEIRFDGPVHPSVERTLAPLVNGRPALVGEVERRLMIARDIDGVRIRSSRFVRENGRGVLIVRVTQDRIAMRAQVLNDGTRPLGPIQARIDVDRGGDEGLAHGRLLLQRGAIVIVVLQGVDLQEGGQGVEPAGEVRRLQQRLLLGRLERQAHGE